MNDTVRDGQIAEAVKLASSYKEPVVLMGDFNTRPTSSFLDRAYSGAVYGAPAYGTFSEAASMQGAAPCRCGEATQGSAKVDFIFESTTAFTPQNPSVEASSYSDHKRLWATLSWHGFTST